MSLHASDQTCRQLRAYCLPFFSQYNAQLFGISYLTSSFLDKFTQSGPNMLYRAQIRTLCRPVLKAPDLVGFLPPSCIATSMAASPILLEYEVSILLLAELREPGMEALS